MLIKQVIPGRLKYNDEQVLQFEFNGYSTIWNPRLLCQV